MKKYEASRSNLEVVYVLVDEDTGTSKYEVYHIPSDTYFEDYQSYVNHHRTAGWGLVADPKIIPEAPKRPSKVPILVGSSAVASIIALAFLAIHAH